MFKKIIIAIVILASLGFMAFMDSDKRELSSIEAGDYDPIVVLELFTSQGCSSCPSADVLLNKVKKQYHENVFALSYHVDYWNYIGWEDPFSKSQYARKQREYNLKFRNRSNYTPQLVVNGREHFVGSSGSKMYDKIKTYSAQKSANGIAVSAVSVKGNNVDFDFHVLGDREGKEVKAVLVLDERTTQVKRGENRNRTLVNSNIVVAEKFFPLDQKNGKGTIEIPSIIVPGEDIQLMVFVEDEVYNITGAVKHKLVR